MKTPPKKITSKLSKLTGKVHTDIAFSTLKYSFFNWVMDEFYFKDFYLNRNIKVLPLNAIKKLTKVALAYWIMDDGSYNKINNNFILCTDSFSDKDILRLIEILKIKYDLSCGKIVYDKMNNTYRIRINKSSMAKLISIVKPYFIPTMYYKLGLYD